MDIVCYDRIIETNIHYQDEGGSPLEEQDHHGSGCAYNGFV